MFKTGDILLKRYRLQKPLGNTALGHQTWLADDLQLPIRESPTYWTELLGLKWLNTLTFFLRPKSYQKVTVKLLAFSPQMQWDQFKLFEREAQVLQALNHPFIPRYHNYFELNSQETNGIHWFGLVQDYIPGSSLEELLNKKELFPEEKVRFIAVEVLNILIYLHQLNPPVLHRDIKPSNLILGEDGRIYLIDFGAVQSQTTSTKVTFTVVGTSGYTPLEQFYGRAVPASDLYALGATLIHLLTGVTPDNLIQKENKLELSDQVKIKYSLRKWLDRLTDIVVEKRYQTAEEALKNIDSDELEEQSPVFLNIAQKTQIQLNKSESSLKISLRSSGFRLLKILVQKTPFVEDNIFAKNTFLKLMIVGGVFGSPMILAITAIILQNQPIIQGSLEVMGGLYFLIICGLILVYLMSFWGGKINLDFSQDSLKVQETIMGLEYYQGKEDYHNIVGVFIHQFLNQYQVSINTRNAIYVLGNKLTKEEALWLAKEIQDWL